MNNNDKLADLRIEKTKYENQVIEIHNRLLTETNMANILRMMSQKRALADRIREISYKITLITN
jgi:hypothetical protein